MKIWVSENSKKEANFFRYIKFPAEFYTSYNGQTEIPLDYDAYIFSSQCYDINSIKYLLNKDKKVIFCIFHGDGVHLPNREEFTKYDNFIILSSARDGNPINILDFPNAHLNMALPLAYFYVLFAVPLYDYKAINFDKKYKVGLWHTPEYRHDRDHMVSQITNLNNDVSLFKILNQKNTEQFNLLIDTDLEISYKFWHCQYFNFLDCEMFLSFESANPYSVPYFCSDKILKGFIMERLGIPTIQIAHPVVLDELKKLGFYMNGYSDYSSDVLKSILNSDIEQLKQKSLEADNLGKLSDMIENGYFRDYLMNIIL
jgi:hypothetical protein